MDHKSALSVVSERLKELVTADNDEDNIETSAAKDCFLAINYLTMLDRDETMRRAIISIVDYIKYLEHEVMMKR